MRLIIAPDFHEKGLLGDAYVLSGSMNLTWNGISVNDEHVLLRTDPAAVAETAAVPSPDQPAREQFWQDGLARLIPIAPQLSRLQRASIVMLATSLGWNAALPEDIAAHPDGHADTDTRLAERLAGKTVAIYTLTESAALQAAETLQTLAPDVDVRISSEHGGSRSLRALAENADLFVVVAASATHAATDFIRMKRGDLPLTYAAGRGAVSILRAVEAWALGH